MLWEMDNNLKAALYLQSATAVYFCLLLSWWENVWKDRYARTVAEIVLPLQANLFMKGSGTRQEHPGVPRTDRSTLNLSFILAVPDS